MKITPIIGLEIHVELKTKSKMFCACDAEHFHVEANTHTCPVCLGLPGALPVPNQAACEWCIKLGLALDCEINQESFFERKNYFYPDLAKSYQLTQLQKPFAINGKLLVGDKTIRINRAHMEEDTGKSVHETIDGVDSTLIDYNRCGVPLVEIVSEPDIDSSKLAKDYLLKMQQIIRYIGVSDADIEKGSMRCEPTVNLKIEDENGQVFYTPLVEIKNVASLSGVEKAIDFEIERQTKAFNETKEVKSPTNKNTFGWDAEKSCTFMQREKEGSADYRYFPEPDIPVIHFSKEQIDQIKSTLPELPDVKIDRYKTKYELSDYDAKLIAEDKHFSDIFDSVINAKGETLPIQGYAKFLANIFNGAIRTYLNDNSLGSDIDISKMHNNYFWDLYVAVTKSEISSTVAKQVIVESYQTGVDPVEIAKSKGLIQVSDVGAIETIAKEVISQNAKAVEDYRKNPQAIGFLVGQLMKASKGAANPGLAKEILEKLLNQ